MKYEDEKYYHIYNRGAHNAPLFLISEHYRYCIRLIDKYFSHYRVSIEAFCLMPNHYHMLVQQMEGGSISRFIQTTFNAYVQGFNVQTKHSGALFQGKAKSLEVDSDEYAVRLCRYIHLNPVIAGLVSNPEEWEWSDYREWIGKPPSNLPKVKQSNFRKVSEIKPSDLPKVSPKVTAKVPLRDIYFESGKAYEEFVSLEQEEQELKKYMLE
jgi:REP element-mobilizing transposase RayT